MIGIALKLLRDELSSYIVQNKWPTDAIAVDDIILHNIAAMDGESQGDFSNKVVLTLVNTEEEITLKNINHVAKTVNKVKYTEPAVFLNLYVLISATLGHDLQEIGRASCRERV